MKALKIIALLLVFTQSFLSLAAAEKATTNNGFLFCLDEAAVIFLVCLYIVNKTAPKEKPQESI